MIPTDNFFPVFLQSGEIFRCEIIMGLKDTGVKVITAHTVQYILYSIPFSIFQLFL